MLNTWNFLSGNCHHNEDDAEKIYFGLCETAFKKRYQNHTSSFRHEKNRNETNFPIISGHQRKIK